ncbi:MAG: hypothetical protein ACRDQB_10130 [Thermocrispum sp.]
MTNPEPYLGPGLSPLQLYLRGERAAVADIVRALEDAAADAQRRINRLETKAGIGSVVRRSQLRMIKRELQVVQNELWRSVGKAVRNNSPHIAEAAALAEKQIQDVLFRAAGVSPSSALSAAQRHYAQATVQTFLARGENGIGLSERVYRSKALSQGWVDRQVNRIVLQGGSWQDIAKTVRPMIRPDTRGGVSYAAKRLGRTELNNAFHTTNIKLGEESPYVTGMKWNLSGSHPKVDICDHLATTGSQGKPAGVYTTADTPSKPHPQCLCFLTEEVVDEETFLRMVTNTSPEQVAKKYAQAARSA